ncbi:MAG: transglutaminase family protein, partial [Nocardioidaceae bacterium]|nr:transglutaminase family protein [Nocardioidaceae bacterium]
DYWGTQVTAFEVHEVHEELTVVSTSTVDVDRSAPVLNGVAWEVLAASDFKDQYCESLAIGARVDPGEELTDRVQEWKARAATPSDLAREIAEFVHSEIRYLPGSTEVTTLASDAWDARAGVCQDMAHLSIGCLRKAGIPARYVSGYLHPQSEPVVGKTVQGESHSWIEWWDGQWVGYDPANAIWPGDRHVLVGRGREYADTAPLRGIYSGAGESRMFVEVQITRLQ